MRQHPIDLLPESIRARSQAGMRTGRYIVAGGASVVLIVLAATHTRLGLERERKALAAARDQADLVLNAEAKAGELGKAISEVTSYVDRYAQIATPLDVSTVMATAVNKLPDGVTLDRIDLDSGTRQVAVTSRNKGSGDSTQTRLRIINVEFCGFAPDDQAIAEYVSELELTAPFENVGLDFSRTRILRNRSAREFRLSFRIDLNVPYDVVPQGEQTGELAMEGTDHE